MKHLITILTAMFAVFAISAQTPNNDLIFANINNVDSPFYYPNLMLRYKEGKPMTEEEYHHLYYGYAFQPSYKPLEVNPSMNRVQEIMARLSIDKPSVSDIDELIAAGIAAMEHDPFSPTLLNILVYAYGTSGDKVRELAYSDHLNGILHCIEQSGDGLKEKSPMHIIMFSHGTDLISSKNIGYRKGQIMSRSVEFVPFDYPRNKVKGYYFDYSRVYWNKPDNYTFERERTWQFNNLAPKKYK
jgi:hypothetical protein